MDNVSSVTAYLKKEIERNGGDPLRETLTIVPALDGAHIIVTAMGVIGGGMCLFRMP